MKSLCIASSGDDDHELSAQEANDIVTRYQAVQFGGIPAFDDVSIDPHSQHFQYTIDGTEYSVPVDYVRHATH